jgi:uncharacterized protein (TIGR02391 family)
MNKAFSKFQKITRKAHKFIEPVPRAEDSGRLHPFEERNVHPEIDNITRKLFDDGHYSQATFEAFKFLDKEVQKISRLSASGWKLMMAAFNEDAPKIKLTKLSNTSEKDEQEGYKFIFSGAVRAIRNPRGHEFGIHETPDQCLDHVSLASLLLRRLNATT